MVRISFLVILFCLHSQVFAAERWALWDSYDANSQQVINHQPWQSFLDNYVRYSQEQGFNLVNYKGVTNDDAVKLSEYISSLTSIDPRTLNRNEQMAYWINLYNAKTVELILENYPVSSIRKLGQGFLSFGPWKDKIITIDNTPLSLDDIEHRILRPIWKDRRIHYAVNCASIGCPELNKQAFTGGNLEDLLNEGEQAYVNHSRGVTLKGDRLVISKIFDWYREDFAENESGLLAYLATHSNASQQQALKSYSGRVRYEYDWSLNEYIE